MNIYHYDDYHKAYTHSSTAEADPEATRLKGKFVPLIPANATLTPPPPTENLQAAVFKNGAWQVVPDYRGKKQVQIESMYVDTVRDVGALKEGYQYVTDEQAESIQQTPDKWAVKDGVLVELTDEEYSAVQFENAKTQKISQNKEAYDNALKAGVTYKDSLFDCDTLAAVRIMGQLTATQTMAIAEESTIDWFDYNYQPVTLTIPEFIELAGVVTMNTRRIETLNCSINTAISNAQTLEDLDAITIDYSTGD